MVATHGEADQGSPTLNRVCTDFPDPLNGSLSNVLSKLAVGVRVVGDGETQRKLNLNLNLNLNYT